MSSPPVGRRHTRATGLPTSRAPAGGLPPRAAVCRDHSISGPADAPRFCCGSCGGATRPGSRIYLARLRRADVLVSSGRGLDPTSGMLRSPEQELVVPERIALVHDATSLLKATPGVEPARPSFSVVGVEANRVGGPCLGDGVGVLDGETSKTVALMRNRDRHAGEVEWPLYGREVGHVDGPGLLGGEP